MSEVKLGGDKRSLGGDEKKYAAQLLPEELWDYILKLVTDPWDRLNCYETCSLFRKILSPWMDDYLQNHPSLRPHRVETHVPKLLPFLNPLEEKGLAQQTDFDFEWRTLLNFRFDDPDYLIPTFCKLLVGRAARFTIRSRPEREDGRNAVLWTKIDNFLELFGSEIWYLSVQFDEPESATDLAKERMLRFSLHDVFQLVPNIRKLSVIGLPDEEPSFVLEFSPDSLPDLYQLETLEFRFASNASTSPKLTDLLRRYHDQIGGLSVKESLLYEFTWPCLTEYHLRLENWSQLESVTPALMRMPNLTKLVVELCDEFRFKEGTSEEDLYHLLSTLNRNFFCTTSFPNLTTLRLTLGMSPSDEEPVLLKVDRPMYLWISSRLKTFELDLGSSGALVDFRFLRYFDSLKNLNVFYRKPSRWDDIALLPTSQIRNWDPVGPPNNTGENGQGEQQARSGPVREPEVNPYLSSKEMYKSNIWEMLPRLKVFTFQWDVCSREGYEDYCRRMEEERAFREGINLSIGTGW